MIKIRGESLLEVFDGKILALVLLLHTTQLLGWDQHVADYMNDTVHGDTILDSNRRESVDLDSDDAAVPCNVNAQGAIF